MAAVVVGLSLPTSPSLVTAPPCRAYVTNASDDTVSVIDTATNTVTATVPAGSSPRGIAFSPCAPSNAHATPGLPPGVAELITQPVPTTAPPSTTVAPSTTTPAPTTTMAPDPAPVLTPDGELPDMAPGDGLLLEDGVEVPVDVTVEQDTDVVLRTLTDDFELRLAGDCDTGCTVVDDESGGETIYLIEGGATRVSGYGFKPGTYSGDFALVGVPVGEHTVQANGISNDDLSRSANLGVVVQTGDVTPSGDLPATGSQPWTSMLGAVLAIAAGLVTLARMKRVTPTRPT